MTRCKTCLYPDTKPDLFFDEEGVCSACRNYQNRDEVNWIAKSSELNHILKGRRKNRSGFDCVVPSSGGKDSHFQVISLIKMGVRPLVVTASTDYLTPIGRENIDNLAKLATTIEVTPNRNVRAKLCRLGLEMVGDVSWPEHASIFSTPFRIAKEKGIDLIFYGESPQREYGGPQGSEINTQMTQRWVSEYGGMLGLRPSDFVGRDGITERDMQDYKLPEPDGIMLPDAYFLGQFLKWDSHQNEEIARMSGMETALPSKANWWNFENLDNFFTGLHDHGMYRKYGYGRMAAQISVDIRRGRVRREHALRIVHDNDGNFPSMYAGVEIGDALRFLGISIEKLVEILDSHTNWSLFDDGTKGKPVRPILKEGSFI